MVDHQLDSTALHVLQQAVGEKELPHVTPRDQALCEFQHSRPNPHNTRFQVVNWVVTLQQITDIPQQQQKRYTTRLQRVKNTTYTIQRSK